MQWGAFLPDIHDHECTLFHVRRNDLKGIYIMRGSMCALVESRKYKMVLEKIEQRIHYEVNPRNPKNHLVRHHQTLLQDLKPIKTPTVTSFA